MIIALSDEAEADLEAIGDYIARDNPHRALTFVAELRGRCESLAEFPERFPTAVHRGKANIRRCGHGNYLIFYQVAPGMVSILHVRHGGSDYSGMFDNDYGRTPKSQSANREIALASGSNGRLSAGEPAPLGSQNRLQPSADLLKAKRCLTFF